MNDQLEDNNTSSVVSVSKTAWYVDFAVLLFVVFAYAFFTGIDFFYAVGYLGLFGFIGWYIYVVIDRWVFRLKYSTSQTKFRKYVIGVAVMAMVLLAVGKTEASESSSAKNARIQIGHHIGEVHALCEAKKYLNSHECPALPVPTGLDKACAQGVASIAPAWARTEVSKALASSETQRQMLALREGLAKNIATAKPAPNYSDAALCKMYEDAFVKTYSNAVKNIEQASKAVRDQQ